MPPIPVPFTLATGARAPTRATPGAAGLDLCAHLPGAVMVIRAGEWARVPTGVSLAIPAGYEGQIRPRSGLALEHGLTVLNSPGTIDSDYRGEIAVLLVNHGTRDVTIRDGDRIAQLVIAPVADAVLTPADSLPPTERGAGGFGSTGTGPAPAPATVPVALHRRSPDAARAYHEGYASALRSMAGWLREKADASENIAAQHGVVGGWLGDCTTDADDRARMEARIRALEAEVSEARAEAAKWAAELDALRTNAAARERVYARTHDQLRARERELDALRAGGAR